MKDWQLRVVIEKAELDIKINALTKRVTETEEGRFVPSNPFDHDMLVAQLNSMQSYSAVLEQRLDNFEED